MTHSINIGATANNGLGDQLRVAFSYVNDNFNYLFTNQVFNLSELNNDIGYITASSIPATYSISSVTGLIGELETLQDQIDILSASFSSVDFTEIQNSINSINNTIITINGTINSQNSLISGLQDQINDIYNIIS